MRRLLVSALSFSLLMLVPVQASAEQRMSLGFTTTKVLEGTNIDVNVASHSVSGTIDMSLMKYEITRSGPTAELRISVRQETASSNCPGTTSSFGDGTQNCFYDSASSRVVVQAGSASATQEVVARNLLRITATTTAVVGYKIQAWVDLNDNDKRDAFEPMSQVLWVDFLPAEMGRELLEFVFMPPSFSNTDLTARILDRSNTFGVVSPDRLSYVVQEFTPYGRNEYTGSLTYTTIGASGYQLTVPNFKLGYPATYVAEIWYERAPGVKIKLASETYGYESIAAGKVVTEVSSPHPSAVVLNDPTEPGLQLGTSGFPVTYTLSATGFDGQPLVGQDVYLLIDTFDLFESLDLRVNGAYLLAHGQPLDQVVLKRKTDANGQVKLEFTSAQQATQGKISIDFVLNGLQGFGWGPASAKRHILWQEPAPRIVPLNARTELPNEFLGRDLALTFEVVGLEDTQLEHSYNILASAEFPLAVFPALTESVDSSYPRNVYVGLSRLATGSGSSLLTLQLVGRDGSVSEAYWRVDWNSENFYLAASPVFEKPMPVIKVSSFEQFAGVNLIELKGAVVNGFGSSLQGMLERFSVRARFFEGEREIGSAFMKLDSEGAFRTYHSTTFSDLSVWLELTNDGHLLSQTFCTGSGNELQCQADPIQRPQVFVSTKRQDAGKVTVTARNVVMAGKIEYFLNGKRMAWVEADSANDPKLSAVTNGNHFIRTLNLVPGKKNILEVFVDGKRVKRVVYRF